MKLECKKISKKFDANVALHEVGLTVEGGDIRALLGGNGSGKSTLSKILGGALNITSGTMELNGKPYRPKSTIEAKRNGVVFTSQELSLFDNMTVEENISLSNYSVNNVIRINKKKIISDARALLHKYGIGGLADVPVKNLAANEQYLVEFMKAVYQDPDVLIIDEITSALYKEDVKIVQRVMNEYKDKGRIVLFISHRMPEIMELCDTVTVLRNGSIITTLSTAEATETQLVSEMTGLDIASANASAAMNVHQAATEDMKTLLSVKDMYLPNFETRLDLDVKAGEIIGIAGLQGHGQSDLVRLLFGLDSACPPTVDLDGKSVTLSNPATAIRHGISFVSGDRGVEGTFEERTIGENVEIVSRMILDKKIEQDEILQSFHVKYQNKSNLITSLSGGNQQKVVLARWLSNSPLVVLADDPTKGIDVQARRDVHKTMVDIARKGSAVLMVSSDDDELVNLANLADYSRIIVLYEGRIVKTLAGSEISMENIAKAAVNL